MHILHDRKYVIKGDTVPTTFKIGSVSTPGDGEINEDKRQWNYRDVNIYKSLNLRIRYNDDDETAGPCSSRREYKLLYVSSCRYRKLWRPSIFVTLTSSNASS